MKTTETIWNEMNAELRSFVRSKIKDEEAVKDILQEVFIKIHTKNGELRDGDKLKTWIYQITRNRIIDHFRKQKPKFGVTELISGIESEKTEDQKLISCVIPLVDKLPGKYGEAIKAVDLNGMMQNEYADFLKISYSGIKSRVQRARQLLKKEFEKCCKISSDKYGNVVSYEPHNKCACSC